LGSITHVNELYVEYADRMSGENPFIVNGKKYEFVWANYSNGRRDIGVYAFHEDRTFGYLAWREMNNLN
jgi:hypothetical protein